MMLSITFEIDQLFDPTMTFHSIKDMTYEELIRNGGPNPNRLLKCTQRAQYCNQLPAFLGREVSVMVNIL